MMKTIATSILVFVLATPMQAPASREHHSVSHAPETGSSAQANGQSMRSRLKLPVRLPVDEWDPGRQVRRFHGRHKPGGSDHGRHKHQYYWPSGSTTVVREIQPIVIVANPPPVAPQPLPEPEKVWVPPVLDTHTQPGYWDYGIRKVWMGDHWRFEQDLENKTWVPESVVTYVKQEGYWKIVEKNN